MIFLAVIVVAISTAIPASPERSSRGAQDPKAAPALTGRTLHADLPVPGAAVTATNGERTVRTTSDDDGVFRFADLQPGVWKITVEMRGFATVTREVMIPPGEPELAIALAMKSYAEIIGASAVKSSWPATDTSAVEAAQILNGSVVNGAASPFAQPRAMGNNRPRQPRRYSGSFVADLGNSAWNSPPYSFGRLSSPLPDYADGQFTLTIGGPFWIPGWFANGPMVRATYAHGDQHNATTRSALVPTLAERAGDLSSQPGVILDPQTGQPFAGNVIPADRIVPQATALLGYYPLRNGEFSTGANFQRPILGGAQSDRLQVDATQNVNPRTMLNGSFGFTRSVTDSVNLFDFVDTGRVSTITTSVAMSRRISTRLNVRASYQFARADNTMTPFFAGLVNVSGDAGISGNDQSPENWGPPTIDFPDFADLTDANYQRTTRTSHVFGGEAQLRRGRHNLTIGGDARLYSIDLLTHQNPRGTISFTGEVTGNAFADFFLGIPTTSAIAFGNTSARISGGTFDAYLDDDFRMAPGLTVDLGVRWEYESPYTERDGRLANLDVAPDFSAVALVLGSDPVGALTGEHYPASLVRRDLLGFEPRLGLSWRPQLTSSLVIRAGYGVYRNLGVYQSIGTLLAQQPPFSNTLSLQNSSTPLGASSAPLLTLANPFPASVPSTTTFAVDPEFTTALLHSWNVSVQRDLPASLTVIAAYFGDRGTHLAQAFLPNTVPPGAANPCPTCPVGFVYLTSGGTSTRRAGQFTLRRRLHSGFTAGLTYTIAKSMDNAATFSNTAVSPGSLQVAQNWLDLDAEYGPSSFDQRHLVSADLQFTTGMGLRGGTLVDGFWGTLYRDWTVTAQFNAGSGLPVTPGVFVAVPGTGLVGMRPALTGEPIEPVESGSYANAAAFATPPPGTWGNAGRNSIRGPSTSSFDMSLARTFRLPRRMTVEWRLVATNVFNRVTFASIDRIITSPQFGQATSANQMRRIQMTFRFGF